MKFTDDPNFDLSFTEYGRQEVFDLIEGTNPPGSVLILSVDDEIADRPGFSWDIEAHFYVVEATAERRGKKPGLCLKLVGMITTEFGRDLPCTEFKEPLIRTKLLTSS